MWISPRYVQCPCFCSACPCRLLRVTPFRCPHMDCICLQAGGGRNRRPANYDPEAALSDEAADMSDEVERPARMLLTLFCLRRRPAPAFGCGAASSADCLPTPPFSARSCCLESQGSAAWPLPRDFRGLSSVAALRAAPPRALAAMLTVDRTTAAAGPCGIRSFIPAARPFRLQLNSANENAGIPHLRLSPHVLQL